MARTSLEIALPVSLFIFVLMSQVHISALSIHTGASVFDTLGFMTDGHAGDAIRASSEACVWRLCLLTFQVAHSPESVWPTGSVGPLEVSIPNGGLRVHTQGSSL